LGTVRFVDFQKRSSLPFGLIRELRLEHEPARIHNGFRHPGLRQFGTAHVANNDQTVRFHNLAGEFMNCILPPIFDPGMEGLYLLLVSGSLSDAEFALKFSVGATRLKLSAIGTGRIIL
jgi:hypothetical protein